jgi:hypothetical protein
VGGPAAPCWTSLRCAARTCGRACTAPPRRWCRPLSPPCSTAHAARVHSVYPTCVALASLIIIYTLQPRRLAASPPPPFPQLCAAQAVMWPILAILARSLYGRSTRGFGVLTSEPRKRAGGRDSKIWLSLRRRDTSVRARCNCADARVERAVAKGHAPVHQRLLEDGFIHFQQQYVVVLEVGAVCQPRALAHGQLQRPLVHRRRSV